MIYIKKIVPSVNMRVILFVGTIVFIISYFMWKFRQIKYNKENPIFYKQGKDAKKKWIIPKLLMDGLLGGYEYSFSFWYYLNDYKYKQYEWKHILTKGTALVNDRKQKPQAPVISFTPKINTMRFGIDTSNGVNRFTLEDVPLKKWTHITLVVNERTAAIYIDGDLSITKELKGMPVSNHGDLLVTHKGGFDGSIASIRYSSRAITPGEVYFVYKAGWNSKGLESNPFKKIWSKTADWASFNFNKEKKFGLCDAAKSKIKQKPYIQFAGRGCCKGFNVQTLYTRIDEGDESCKELCKENNSCVAATFKISKNGNSCTLHKHARGLKMKDMKDFKTNAACQRTKCFSKRFNLNSSTRRANEKWEETVDKLHNLQKKSKSLIRIDVKKEKKSLKKWNNDARKAYDKLDKDKSGGVSMYEWSGGQIGMSALEKAARARAAREKAAREKAAREKAAREKAARERAAREARARILAQARARAQARANAQAQARARATRATASRARAAKARAAKAASCKCPRGYRRVGKSKECKKGRSSGVYRDFQTVSVSAPKRLEVTHCSYLPGWSNRTSACRRLVKGGKKIYVTGGIHTRLGDPRPGVPKRFRLSYNKYAKCK